MSDEPSRLVLFDIDGTLLQSERSGTRAMHRAGRSIWGEQFTLDGVPISGSLDTLIWKQLAARNNLDSDAMNEARFRTRYCEMLQSLLENEQPVQVLPGATRLVDECVAAPDMAVGLMTGNYPESGTMKLEAAGIGLHHFEVCVWGDDGQQRRDLTAKALDWYESRIGRESMRERVVVIGDTTNDVDCAQHHGCRCLAVATGGSSYDELRNAGADLVVETLEETAALMAWINEYEK